MKRIINDKFTDSLIWVMFILCMGFLLIFPAESSYAVKEGCELFYNSILPTLFPFFVVSSFAVNAGISDTLGIPLKSFLRRVFGITSGEYTYTVSVLSGYPTSAKIISGGYNDGIISRRDATVLLILCSNGSAAFIISYVGASLLGNMTAAYILLLTNYISPIISAKILSRSLPGTGAFLPEHSNTSKHSYISAFISAVMSSMMSVLNVGAFIIFFNVIRSCALHIAGNSRLSSLIFSLIELSAGCNAITGEDLFLPVTVGLIGFLIGFGGVCVLFQSLAFIEATDLDRSLFVKYKLICGMINGMLSFLLSLLFCTDISVSAIIGEGMHTVKTNEANILLLGILLFIIFLSVRKKDSENKT